MPSNTELHSHRHKVHMNMYQTLTISMPLSFWSVSIFSKTKVQRGIIVLFC